MWPSTPAERRHLASRCRTCCLRRFRASRPPQSYFFRGSIPHPIRSLCTLRIRRRRRLRNTRFPAVRYRLTGAGLSPAGSRQLRLTHRNRKMLWGGRRGKVATSSLHLTDGVAAMRGVDDVNGLKAAWRLVFPLYAGNIPNADEHGIEGTPWTEFVTRVEPEDLTVNTKKRLSAFYPTDLDFLLRNLDVRTVVLNGGFTDCCILNAAFDASNLGYNLVVLRDLVRGTNQEMEDAALKIVSLHLGLVLDSADLLDRWRNEGSFTPADQLSGGRPVVMHPE